MTILTKATDKKKLLPIPTAPISHPSTRSSSQSDVEAAAMLHARHRAKTTTLLVFLIAILVLLMGILAGVCFYRSYLRQRVHRLNCYIPYYDNDVENIREESYWLNNNGPTFSDFKMERDGDEEDDVDSEGIRNILKQMLERFEREYNDPMKEIRSMETEMRAIDGDKIQKNWFREEVEVKDDDSDSYADIKIPDFRGGRRGRFIHDYNNNQTTIIDESGDRCFIYPLDYETTLPPTSLTDVFIKMQTGYYLPDTTVLRKKMRVVIPELSNDDDYISLRTSHLCRDMKIYRLEQFVGGVSKRSIDVLELADNFKFAEFAGVRQVELDLINMNEVLVHENMKSK